MSRAAFYHSPQWRKLSRAFLLSRNYICQRCGAPAEIAHRKQHLTAANVSNPEIGLNPDNLEALCLACHNAEHFSAGGATAAGLAFDGDGNLIQESEENSHD